ncbi:MAG: hypothetical protein PVI30_21455 [Myxococcales bacterium]|jgi:hypothetical protein
MMTRLTTPTETCLHAPVALALVAAVGVTLSACDETEEPPDTPTVENVEEHPEQFLGKRITLTGEVDDVYSNQAFELEEISWLFDDEVLVLTRKPVNLGAERLEDGMLLSVTGTPEKLIITEVEEQLGWDLDPELEVKWKDKLVFVADRVRALHSFAEWSEQDDPAGTIVSLWAVHTMAAPLELAGAKITLESVTVAEISKKGLWVGIGGSPDLFVAPDAGVELPKVKPGSAVQARGILDRMPPPAEAVTRFELSEIEQRRAASDALYLRAQSLKPIADERSAQAPAGQAPAKKGG